MAGSDSCGGAGLQADIKAVSAMGGFASCAATALTAQDTAGVRGVLPAPAAFVRLQIEVVLEDVGADAVKTGMLHDREVVEAAADALSAPAAAALPLVADPVMAAASGDRLLDPSAEEALRRLVLPRAALATPNLPEAEALLGRAVARTPEGLAEAARALLDLGPRWALLKGGHGEGPECVDLLAGPGGRLVRFRTRRRALPRGAHGTGCSLAAAAAEGLARGLEPPGAVARALSWLRAAIDAAPPWGRGAALLHHAAGAAPPPPAPAEEIGAPAARP